jgi:hypothetical protein
LRRAHAGAGRVARVSRFAEDKRVDESCRIDNGYPVEWKAITRRPTDMAALTRSFYATVVTSSTDSYLSFSKSY